MRDRERRETEGRGRGEMRERRVGVERGGVGRGGRGGVGRGERERGGRNWKQGSGGKSRELYIRTFCVCPLSEGTGLICVPLREDDGFCGRGRWEGREREVGGEVGGKRGRWEGVGGEVGGRGERGRWEKWGEGKKEYKGIEVIRRV